LIGHSGATGLRNVKSRLAAEVIWPPNCAVARNHDAYLSVAEGVIGARFFPSIVIYASEFHRHCLITAARQVVITVQQKNEQTAALRNSKYKFLFTIYLFSRRFTVIFKLSLSGKNSNSRLANQTVV
jgi:hypothetical protein